MNDHRIPLEACPSSNVQTGAVRDIASHPIKFYYDLGLRVTVNTDNRLVTDTTVSNELWLCHSKMGMSLPDIKSIIVSGFKSAFMPFHIKQSYLRRATEELERFMPDGRILPQRKAESPQRRGTDAWSPRDSAPSHPSSNMDHVDLCPDDVETPMAVDRATASDAN